MLLQAETDALAGGVASDFRTQALADQWAAHCTFYNGCGPTETTIVNTLHRHEPSALLTIGRPTPNNTVYVLDEQGARL